MERLFRSTQWVASGTLLQKIVSGDGDYVLQVKGNQLSLQEAIESSFTEVDAAEATQTKARRSTTKEKSRGRQEVRHYTIMPLPDSMVSDGKEVVWL